MSGAAALVLAILGATLGCGDDAPPPSLDAGVDATVITDAALDAEIRPPTPLQPMLPRFTPCPPSWREVAEVALGGAARCEPWPETGRATCAPGSMHLPGTLGCEQVTTDCPADGFPADLPTEIPVVFVRSGAPLGGDGTRALPYGMLAEAYAAVPDGGILALSVGAYGEALTVDRPVTLWGACAETRIERVPAGLTQLHLLGSSVVVRNLSIAGLRPVLVGGGSAEIRDVVFTGVGRTAIDVTRGRVLVDRVTVDSGDALMDSGGDAEVTIRRVAVSGTRYGGLTATSGHVVVEDSVFFGIAEGSGSPVLAGVTATPLPAVPTVVRFERVAFEENFTSGFYVTEGGTLELVDTVLRPVRRPSMDVGIGVFGASTARLERVFLDGPNFQGVAIGEPRATAELTDVWIRDVIVDGVSGRGQAIEVALGGSATIERLLVERATGIALLASAGDITARDLVVRETAPRGDGQFGRALQVQVGGNASVERVRIESAHEVGAVAAGGRAVLTLVDATIVGTLANECVPGTCAGGGFGLGAYIGGRIDASRFSLQDNALAGAQLAVNGEIDLSDGEVSDHPVGVNIQVPGYDVTRLTDNVVYRRNGANLDSTSLPVPSPTAE